jgi:hypothetical protein
MSFRLFELVCVAVLCSRTIGLRLVERISHAQQNLGLRKVEKIGGRPAMTLKRSSPAIAAPSSEPTRIS